MQPEVPSVARACAARKAAAHGVAVLVLAARDEFIENIVMGTLDAAARRSTPGPSPMAVIEFSFLPVAWLLVRQHSRSASCRTS